MLAMFNSGNFFLMVILGGSMQSLWGMIRAVQIISNSGLVNINIPINMFIFLKICIIFAQMDIIQGEDIIAKYLKFHETGPVNKAFEFFGIDDKNFINNSGSYFFIFISLFLYMMLKIVLNQIAKCLANYFYPRLMGIWAYEDRYG